MLPPPQDDTPDPRQADLSRRSKGSPLGLWLPILVVLLVGVAAYVIFAL